MTAISKRIVRFFSVGVLLAFMAGAPGKAQDELPGWSIDPEGVCHWIGGEATAGVTTVGTTDYPNGAMVRKETMTGNETRNRFKCGVIDADRGYAWFGTYTNPGIVVKVALGDGTELPRPVGYAALNYGEGFLVSAVIDKVNGFAYFGTQVTPSYVVKVSLGEGDDPPVRIGAATLNSSERSPFAAVIDVPNGYAYFGTDMTPAQVVKIRLGEGYEPPVRVGAVTLPSGESNLWCGVIDSSDGYAYFGTNTSYARVIKIQLGDGDNPPQRIGHVELSNADNERYLRCGVINPLDGYALFGTDTSPGCIVKIALGNGASPPMRLGSIPLSSSETHLASAVIDSQNGYACFGTNVGGTNRVIKVETGDKFTLPVRIGSTPLQDEERFLQIAVADDEMGYIYFGTDTSPAAIVKLEAGGGADLPERVGSLVFDDPDRQARCAVIDEVNGYAYIGTDTAPGKVIKIRLSDGTSRATRVGAIELNSGENNLSSAVIDPATGFAYFGTGTSPGRVVKVALGEDMEPPSRVGVAILNDGEIYLESAVIAPEEGFAYFGTNTTPGRVVEVRLGEGMHPPERTGVLILDQGENGLWCALINPSIGYAWFGTMTSPAQVVKVAIGYGNSLVRMGTLQFPTGRNQVQNAVIDPVTNYGYFVSTGNPNRLVKVALGWGWTPPEYIGELELQSQYGPCPSAIDRDNGFVYIGSRDGVLEKVSLGTGNEAPECIGSLEAPVLENQIACSFLDKEKGCLYFATITDPIYLARFVVSHRNYIKGTSLNMPEAGEVNAVSMYSHSASGHLRLALYNYGLTPELLWQSPVISNTMEEGWLEVLIDEGTSQRLFLETGDYWLVWQTDSMGNVPSYLEGDPAKGIRAIYNWSDFPDSIGMNTPVSPTLTSDQWSAFIRYEPRECFETACLIRMPSHDFTEGDPCDCVVDLCNAELGILLDIPLFVVLDIYGSYYFAPSFDDVDWYKVTVPPGKMTVTVLPEFPWPSNAGSASGIRWLAAMTNSRMTEIIGEMGEFTFGWR